MKGILIALTIGVYLIAIGALGMAYYQRVADSGIFIQYPDPHRSNGVLIVPSDPTSGVQLL
jgi:hypothetical protein